MLKQVLECLLETARILSVSHCGYGTAARPQRDARRDDVPFRRAERCPDRPAPKLRKPFSICQPYQGLHEDTLLPVKHGL